MATHITIYDGTTPMLDYIASQSPKLARKVLSITGSTLRDNARDNMRRERHFWHHITINGKRKIYKSKTQQRVLGTMTSHGKKVPYNINMSDIITFYMPKFDEKNKNNLSVTIGGAHKRFNAEMRDEWGNVIGYKSTHGVKKVTRSIFHKLNTGELDKYHPYRKNDSGYESTAKKYKGYGYMDKVNAKAKGKLVEKMQENYIKVVPKLINNKDFKVRGLKIV